MLDKNTECRFPCILAFPRVWAHLTHCCKFIAPTILLFLFSFFSFFFFPGLSSCFKNLRCGSRDVRLDGPFITYGPIKIFALADMLNCFAQIPLCGTRQCVRCEAYGFGFVEFRFTGAYPPLLPRPPSI